MAYAVSKMAGMQLCLAYNQQYGGTKFIPLIPNSVYGPNDNFDPNKRHVLSSLIKRFRDAKIMSADKVVLWDSRNPKWEFIHADDLADACALLLESDTSDLSLPINVGSRRDLSIRELAGLVAAAVGYRGAIGWDTDKPNGAPRKLLDSTLHAHGWRARIGLRDGVNGIYAWYRQHKTAEAVS